MNVIFNPVYWFADKEKRFEMLADQLYKDKPYEREIAYLNHEFPTNSEKETPTYMLRHNEIEYKYQKIDEYSYELKKILVNISDEKERKLKTLDLDYKFEKVSQIEYLKTKATIENKPFVAVKPNFDETDGDNFYLDIEFNEIFIEKLKKEGYTGDDDQEIVDQWLKWKMIKSFDNIGDIFQNEIPTAINRIDIGDGKKLVK